MTGLRFLLAIAGLHVAGWGLLTLLPAGLRAILPRFPATGLAGLLFVGGEMLAFSFLAISWTLPRLLALPTLVVCGGLLRRGGSREIPGPRSALLVIAAGIVALAAYGSWSARATSADFVLFWGAKGERFALARGIAVPFLKAPEHYLMHPDYPPLLPFLYAFGSLAAGRFPWGASLLVMPWFLAMTVSVFHGVAEKRLDHPRESALLTAVFAGVLGLTGLVTCAAGSADAGLIAFETAALAVLLSTGGGPSEWIAGAAFAGACLLKLEGLFVSAIVISGVILVCRPGWRRRLVSAARLSLFPAIGLGSWLLFCRANGLIDFYRGGQIGAFTLKNASRIPPAILHAAAYDYAFLPWIALALTGFAFRQRGWAFLPLWTAGAFLSVNVYFYLHGTADPTIWIWWSAGRTLITVLTCGSLAIGGHGRESNFSDRAADDRERRGMR